MENQKSFVPAKRIEQSILLIRGQKVMLDTDLAALYGVEAKQLKRAVRRNISRFPKDFMFELTKDEYQSLRSQFGTLKRGEHSKYLPYAFTEQGVAMLSSVLRSKRAVQVNIEIMRAFVRLRKMLASNVALARKLTALEKNYDEQFKVVFESKKVVLHMAGGGNRTREEKKHQLEDVVNSQGLAPICHGGIVNT